MGNAFWQDEISTPSLDLERPLQGATNMGENGEREEVWEAWGCISATGPQEAPILLRREGADRIFYPKNQEHATSG